MGDDEEIKQLLRELRDIALRNEKALQRDVVARRRVFVAIGCVLVVAGGALLYLFSVLYGMTQEMERSKAQRSARQSSA